MGKRVRNQPTVSQRILYPYRFVIYTAGMLFRLHLVGSELVTAQPTAV